MLEQRVARLEQILERLEPKISEILLTGGEGPVSQSLQVELAEAPGRVSDASSLAAWLIVAIVATWSASAGSFSRS